jgi:hypothetical protein
LRTTQSCNFINSPCNRTVRENRHGDRWSPVSRVPWFGQPLCQSIIIDFHLEFFVKTVDHVGLDALHQGALSNQFSSIFQTIDNACRIIVAHPFRVGVASQWSEDCRSLATRFESQAHEAL